VFGVHTYVCHKVSEKTEYTRSRCTFHSENITLVYVSMRWRSWLRHCATSRKVAGSIPDGAIFHWHNPSGRTMALGSTQPLTEKSTRNIFWRGKCGWCVGIDLSTFTCRLSWNLGASTSWNPLGLNRRKHGLLYVYMCRAQAMLLVERRTKLSVHICPDTVTTVQKADITTASCLGWPSFEFQLPWLRSLVFLPTPSPKKHNLVREEEILGLKSELLSV
jgi:hypothetical protein